MKNFLLFSFTLIFFFNSCIADDIDPSTSYESSVEFDKAYDCVQTAFGYDRLFRCATEALKVAESFKNPDPKKIATVRYKYGLSLSRKILPEKKKGLKELTRASHLIENAFGPTSCEMASVLFDLASTRSQEKILLDSTFSDYEKSLSICVLEKNTNYAIKILSFVQSFELEKLNEDQLASAKSFSIQAYEIFQKFMGPSDIGTRAVAFELGQLYFLTHEHQKSVEIFEKSYPQDTVDFKNNMGTNPDTLDLMFSYLAESHEKLGNIREADKYKALKSVARLSTGFELDPRIANPDLTPIFIKQPFYPKLAQKRGKQGYAVVEVTVLPSGKVRDPRLLEEYPEKLFFGQAAMRVAKRLLYIENPERPEQKVIYKYTFKMR